MHTPNYITVNDPVLRENRTGVSACTCVCKRGCACVCVPFVAGKNTRNTILKVRMRDSLRYSFKNAQSVHQSEEVLPTLNIPTMETAPVHVAVFAVLQPLYQHMTSNNHANEVYVCMYVCN